MTPEIYDAHVAEDAVVFPDLKALLRPEDVTTVFDIGACEGEDSLRYARLFPQAKVFAFEPLPANQKLIRHHFARLRAERCELVPWALSDRNGEATFHVSSGTPEDKPHGDDWDYGNKSSSLLAPERVGHEWVPWLKFEERIRVPTQRLDDFCADRAITEVDLMHIDVQGAEWLVLQGAQRMLPATKCIWMEVADAEIYQGQRTREEIEAWLGEHQFQAVRRDQHGLENDVLYVNLRYPRSRQRWRQIRRQQVLRKIRRRLGAALRKLLPLR